jgi:hypothetical protein
MCCGDAKGVGKAVKVEFWTTCDAGHDFRVNLSECYARHRFTGFTTFTGFFLLRQNCYLLL